MHRTINIEEVNMNPLENFENSIINGQLYTNRKSLR